MPTGASHGQQGIRYVNVGSFSTPGGSAAFFDVVLENRSKYIPFNASLNGLRGTFAQVNLACNQAVQLRVYTKLSCAQAQSCALCTPADASCFSEGCACFSTTVYSEANCTGEAKEAHRAAYSCTGIDVPLILPGNAMVGMTVYDFDTGELGDYVESLTVPGYEYYKTPLRAQSGNAITSTIQVNQDTRTFTSTALGTIANNPTDPQMLTDEQAANGIQFFFRSQYGYCLLYTSPSPRDRTRSRMPSSA